jgi:hypothetical protein
MKRSGFRRWISPALGQGKGLNRRPFPWTPSWLKHHSQKGAQCPLPLGSSFDEKMLLGWSAGGKAFATQAAQVQALSRTRAAR